MTEVILVVYIVMILCLLYPAYSTFFDMKEKLLLEKSELIRLYRSESFSGGMLVDKNTGKIVSGKDNYLKTAARVEKQSNFRIYLVSFGCAVYPLMFVSIGFWILNYLFLIAK